jgi:hypothetical protein
MIYDGEIDARAGFLRILILLTVPCLLIIRCCVVSILTASLNKLREVQVPKMNVNESTFHAPRCMIVLEVLQL